MENWGRAGISPQNMGIIALGSAEAKPPCVEQCPQHDPQRMPNILGVNQATSPAALDRKLGRLSVPPALRTLPVRNYSNKSCSWSNSTIESATHYSTAGVRTREIASLPFGRPRLHRRTPAAPLAKTAPQLRGLTYRVRRTFVWKYPPSSIRRLPRRLPQRQFSSQQPLVRYGVAGSCTFAASKEKHGWMSEEP